jgi:hypothetical protein
MHSALNESFSFFETLTGTDVDTAEPVRSSSNPQALQDVDPVPTYETDSLPVATESDPSSVTAPRVAERTLSREDMPRDANPDSHVDYPAVGGEQDQPLSDDLDQDDIVWNEDGNPADNFRNLSDRLSATGGVYRGAETANGLLAFDSLRQEVKVIEMPDDLSALFIDKGLKVRVRRQGKTRARFVPSNQLKVMLGSETFLRGFLPLDGIVHKAYLRADNDWLRPGYNDGPPGARLFYVGEAARREPSRDAMNRFLGVMEFEGDADRANAIGAALTVMLRYRWPGAKPLILVTSTKSHGGKDTIIEFARGSTPRVSVMHQSTDWAFQHHIVQTLNSTPNVGVLNIENVRLDRRSRQIASASLEQFLTDPQPTLQTTRSAARRIHNTLVVAMSTNEGVVSEDLMNRALPIHLSPKGNVADRKPPIGNPKLTYLPANRLQIEAELRGMVEKWKEDGCPLDHSVKHPFGQWAATIGGILKANGIRGFLANYARQRTVNDPIREALGRLGIARRNEWLRPGEWADVAGDQGVLRTLIPDSHRDSDASREQSMGTLLSGHESETFTVSHDDDESELCLKKERKRTQGQDAKIRYAFVTVSTKAVAQKPSLDRTASEDCQDGLGI